MDVVPAPLADLAAELAAACDQHDAVVEAMREVAARHRVWLLGGSMPMRRQDRVINHAPLVAPNGRVGFQDKHRPTRFEAELWGLSGGRTPGVFETPWGRIGVCICYDSEFPPLVRAQVAAGAWLLLVPACTDTMAGFNRVRLAPGRGRWRTSASSPWPPPSAMRPGWRRWTRTMATPPCSARWIAASPTTASSRGHDGCARLGLCRSGPGADHSGAVGRRGAQPSGLSRNARDLPGDHGVALIYLVAGETSGDVLGGRLMAALRRARPDAAFSGVGGPRMQARG